MTLNYLMLFVAVFFIFIYLFIIGVVFSENTMMIKKDAIMTIKYKEIEKEDINSEGLNNE